MDNKTAVYDPYWARKGEKGVREREKKMMEHAVVKNLSNDPPLCEPTSTLRMECGIRGKTDSSLLRIIKIVKTGWIGSYLAVLRKLRNGRKVCFIGGSCFRPPLRGLANYKILLVAMQSMHLWRLERPTSRWGKEKEYTEGREGAQTSGEFANKLDVAKGEEWGSLGKNIRKSSDARSWCV